MKRRMVLAGMAVALALTGTAALAHGPSRQKVALEVKLNATPAEVWAAIGNFYDMSWHPVVAETQGDGSMEVDKSTRVLVLKSDVDPKPTIKEVLAKFQPEKMSYSYRIEEVSIDVLPVTNYASTLTVKDDGGKATVEWKGGFYRGNPLNNPEPQYNDEAAVKAVTGVYQAGLDALAEKFGKRE